MASHAIGEIFCLYLWRSAESPGTLYLARGVHNARAVCAELMAVGYIVKIVEMATNVEFEMRDGRLIPSASRKPAEEARSSRRLRHRHVVVPSMPAV